MKRIILFVTAALCSLSVSFANNTVSVSYQYPVYNTDGDPKSGIKEWKETSQTCTKLTTLSSTMTELTGGWYVVDGTVTFSNRIRCMGSVNIVINDNVKMTASAGITVNSGNTLNIFAHSLGNLAGSLTATATDGEKRAGIGGDVSDDSSTSTSNTSGTITINGGCITVSGGKYAAGIGGGGQISYHDAASNTDKQINGVGKNITVNAGTVTATGGQNGAAIGGGYCAAGEDIVINGGLVKVTGGQYAAGIGSGFSNTAKNIYINGGNVVAWTEPSEEYGPSAIGNGGSTLYRGGEANSDIYINTSLNLFADDFFEKHLDYDNKMSPPTNDASYWTSNNHYAMVLTTPTQFGFKSSTYFYENFTCHKMTADDLSCDNELYFNLCGFTLKNTSNPTNSTVTINTDNCYFCQTGMATVMATLRGTDLTSSTNINIVEGTNKLTVIDGTNMKSNEGPCYLFDRKYSAAEASKWFVKDFSSAYVVFQLDEAAVVTYYMLYTADDNATNTGRNPRSWVLYGSNTNNGSDWTALDTRTDNTSMPDENFKYKDFSVSGNTTAYKYYKLVITANCGDNAMQLGEMFLLTQDGKIANVGHNYDKAVCTICGDKASTSDPYHYDQYTTDKLKTTLYPRTQGVLVQGAQSDFNTTTFNLDDITIDNKTYTLFQVSDNAFKGNTMITDLTIKEGLDIPSGAFQNTKIKTVKFGQAGTLSDNAFSGCTELTDIYCKNPVEAKIPTAFGSGDFSSLTLHIPDASYQNLNSDFVTFKDVVSLDNGKSLLPAATLTDVSGSLTADNVFGYRAGKITYTRNVTGACASFCFPFEVKLSSITGIESAYTPVGWSIYNTTSDGVLLFMEKKEADATIAAGTPFLAKLVAGTTSLTVQNNKNEKYEAAVTENPTSTTALSVYKQEGNSGVVYRDNNITTQWCGTYFATDITGMKSFNSDGTFTTHTGNISPYAAYISQTGSSPARNAVIYVDFDGTATAISEVGADSNAGVNVNLNLGFTYNIAGQRLAAPQKGLNIISGKKVFVK